MPQVGRRLVLAGRHQVSVGADHIVLAADLYMLVVLGADVFRPYRLLAGEPAKAALHRPGPCQRVIDGGDLVIEYVWIALIAVDALLDHRLLVLVERDATVVVGVRALDAARLNHQRVELAVAIRSEE